LLHLLGNEKGVSGDHSPTPWTPVQLALFSYLVGVLRPVPTELASRRQTPTKRIHMVFPPTGPVNNPQTRL